MKRPWREKARVGADRWSLRRYKPKGVNRLDATKCAKCGTKVFPVFKLQAADRRASHPLAWGCSPYQRFRGPSPYC